MTAKGCSQTICLELAMPSNGVPAEERGKSHSDAHGGKKNPALPPQRMTKQSDQASGQREDCGNCIGVSSEWRRLM